MSWRSTIANACAVFEASLVFRAATWAAVIASTLSLSMFNPADTACESATCQNLRVWMVLVDCFLLFTENML